MLLFRSEEHIGRWCKQWNQPRGELFSSETGWKLAQSWFEGRVKQQRRTVDEAHALFAELGLTSDFWKLA